MAELQNSPVEFAIPEDIENWVKLWEGHSAWPGAFASVRRHQEAICHVDAALKKRRASAIQETRIPRPRLAETSIPGRYSETGLEATDLFGPGPSGSMQAPRPATSLELYPPTLDETIVNIHLVLLLQELTNLRRSSDIDCTITRVRFNTKFGTNSFTAVVDGVVQSKRTKRVLSILKVKPMVRYAKPAAVQMQETAEAIGWLKQQTGGLPQLKDESRLIIYQGRHEVFLTLMTPGTRYVEYLETTIPTTPEPETFLKLKTFGPRDINQRPDLEDLCPTLISFLLAAEEAAQA
ncbi:hypothetical protein KXV92_007636 [Aspergillus fumigatus]|nr:hypothetical protein KXV94_008815 [Aspergillus fumigatus]KAH3207978.1 hypothetical protein KXV92_007636 [Aspergillus fumigatus]